MIRKFWSAPLSRRSLFEAAISVVGATAILFTAAYSARAAKMSRPSVSYQPSPKNGACAVEAGSVAASARPAAMIMAVCFTESSLSCLSARIARLPSPCPWRALPSRRRRAPPFGRAWHRLSAKPA
jgi:hypothetical protein